MPARSKSKKKSSVRSSRNSSDKSKKTLNWAAISTYLVIFSVFFFLLAVGITRIYLDNKTSELKDKISTIKNDELKLIEREKQNLLTGYAKLTSGDHIKEKAKALGLDDPAHGVVRKMGPPSTEKLREYIKENKE